jgi:hypothetical protein
MADPSLAWAFVGVGVFGEAVAALLAWRSLRRLNAGGRAVGQVVGNDEQMVERSKGAPRKFYFPVIAFESAGGVRTTFRSDTGRPVPIPEGQALPVVFDPARPSVASVATFRTLWLFPALVSAVGLPFLLAGLAALV